jgi:hypothetical protein
VEPFAVKQPHVVRELLRVIPIDDFAIGLAAVAGLMLITLLALQWAA